MMTALEIAQFKILFELELRLRSLPVDVRLALKNWRVPLRLTWGFARRMPRYLYSAEYFDKRTIVMIALGITLVPAWFVLAVLYVMEAGA